MKTAAIITGGKSPEHEVAIVSARNICNAIDTEKYLVCVIGISRTGVWYHLTKNSLFEDSLEIGTSPLHRPLILVPFDSRPLRYLDNPQEHLEVDVFFPIAHGVFGEDGILQGVLEYLDKPYVGPGVLGSSVGMDKEVSKIILKHHGIPVTPWVTCYRDEETDWTAAEKLGYPIFVKPANMGSGVGVEKAENREELVRAVDQAFRFDFKILIEKGIQGREVETAVLGNRKAEVSGVGEIIVGSGFYTYENKYVNSETRVVIPAENFPVSGTEILRKAAMQAYRCLQLEGLSRIDFFYVSDHEFYLNEVNTLPGFTNISMYPKLWEHAGLKYSDLLTRLLELAEERYAMRSTLQRTR